MLPDSEDPFSNLFRQVFPFLFGLLDDALIVGLSRMGCHLPWLEWLSPLVMTGTLLYIGVQVWNHGVPKLLQAWRNLDQEPEAVES
jgi:hypothetical protein